MKEKDPIIYIRHIADSIKQIQAYTKEIDQEEFLKNRLIQDAVIRNFEVIGEATKNLSAEFRMNHSQIQWKQIAGMRDKLIHDYIGVDLWAVWATVEDVLPTFQAQITEIIKKS